MPIARLARVATVAKPQAAPQQAGTRTANRSKAPAMPADSLHFSGAPVTLPMRHVQAGNRLDRQAIVARFADEPTTDPVVFLNYDETVSKGEAAPTWTAIGNTADGPLRPASRTFRIVSSHADGNPASSLQVGFALANTGRAPLEVTLSLRDVGPKTGSAPRSYIQTLAPATRTVTLPPRGRIDVPIAATTAHPAGTDPRDAARMVTFEVGATVVSGDPAALTVHDVARFPQAPAGAPVHDAGGVKHHEGVFLTQIQTTPPPVLSPRNLAYIKISGSNAAHDAHYYALHRAFVAIPANDPPRTLVFMGPGGTTHPIVGNHPLPAIGDTFDGRLVRIGGQSYQEDRQRKEFSLGFDQAVGQGYLEPTGQRDAQDNPIYEVDVRFVAGDNGDLGVYGKW